MASSAPKQYILRSVNKRRFGSAAVKHAAPFSSEVKVSTLPNKVTAASTESVLPISRLSVVIKAGSRYDPIDAPGLNHVLRSSAGLTTSQASTFAITRNIQQIGGSLSVTGNRDTIAYTLEATADNIEHGYKFLNDVVTHQVFKPWELEDNVPRIEYELNNIPPQAKLIDILHKAAFRTGLGNPLIVRGINIGTIGSETLQHYVANYFTGSRTAVIGVGVNDDSVKNFAGALDLESGSGSDSPSKYYGGEVFEEAPGIFSHIAIASEAAGLKDKEILAYAILRYALGGWSTIKYSAGNSPLAKAVAGTTYVQVNAFNAVHSDAGLFGIILSAPAYKAKSAFIAATKAAKEKISNEAINGAKNQLKIDILESANNGEEVANAIASSVINGLSYQSPTELAAAIDNVSSSDVQAAQSKFISGKKTIATYGNLSALTYLDELK